MYKKSNVCVLNAYIFGYLIYGLGSYFNREKVFNETTLEVLGDTDNDSNGVINAADCAAGLPVACKVRNQFDQIKKSYALYTDLKYKVTDALTLRGGLRLGLRHEAAGLVGGAPRPPAEGL